LNKIKLGLIALSAVAGLLILFTVILYKSSPSIDSKTNFANVPSQTEDSQSDQNLDRKLDMILAGISQLNSDVNNLNQRVAELEESGDSKSTEVIGSNIDEAYGEPDIQAIHSNFTAFLDEDFAAEPLSLGFSERQQDEVHNLFLDVEKPYYQNVQIKNLECRSSSCKVEVVLEGNFNSGDFESEFMVDSAKLGLSRVRGYEKNESGQKSHVYFLSAAKTDNSVK
jgi:hypothetical protein